MDEDKRGFIGRRVLERVERGLEEGACGERGEFFEAMAALMHGDVERASDGFRRARRSSPTPYDALSCYGLGRCEVLQGRAGAALRFFRKVATGTAPPQVRQLAWKDIELLALSRDDRAGVCRARRAIEALEREIEEGPEGSRS
ncbi:hypothetical protein DL240_11490 [Lujinxingia litoralis]|uniref:Tetratricopeptide repeat protein n=1 Tax=Lujinxingia litoralis TaxID=2211119 RepID=A0A328C564_9DELT|nr:hypothetical protein [Lujinxingia litoralis]RAL22461.1 hypothetical protein DL240_11490 [Lujinxingia litoralis]